jgi:hypothetical protein
MGKPYIRKIRDEGQFAVWLVDGNWIRSNLDPEFDNFAQYYLFEFIPRYEIWIDEGVDPHEMGFFIARSIYEWDLYSQGGSHDDVEDSADEFETSLREEFHDSNRHVDPDKAKLELYHTTQDGTELWIVDGEYVREPPGGNLNFTAGAHWLVPGNEFIPEGEIWIDNQIEPEERQFVAIHELCENLVMSETGVDYETAHADYATPLEEEARENPSAIGNILLSLLW